MAGVSNGVLGAAALAYIARKWPVFPCKKREKIPMTTNGFKAACCDEFMVSHWWRSSPEANIAIPTGAVSGFIVVDLDGEEGDETARQWEQERGAFERTPEQITGGNGRQIFFRHPGFPIPNRTRIAPGVDIRGDGGYVIVPPSIHPSGRAYEWDGALHPDDVAFAKMPNWLIDLIVSDQKREQSEGLDVAAIMQGVPEGQRDITLFKMAAKLRRSGVPKAWAIQLVTEAAANCTPPFSKILAIEKVRSAYERYTPNEEKEEEKRKPLVVSIVTPGEPKHTTDMGNAERFSLQHSNDVRYCSDWAKWLLWSGHAWGKDNLLRIQEMAKETVKSIYAEAAGIDEKNDRVAAGGWAKRSEAGARIESMIGLARSIPPIPVTPGELDADPWLLNCLNGTLDLRTGELREHTREDLITKFVPVEYEPEADCPTWKRILYRLMDGKQEMVDFLQRAVGYSLTGDTSERVMFILHGSGANGKTTFLETVHALLNDYAMRTRTEMLMVKREGGIPNDVARLKGARFVFASEAEEGRKIAESLVKDLTGGDTISARFMRAEWFDFRPEFKLWLGTNHKPEVRGTDNAIWSRIRLIPFTVTISEAERIPRRELAEALGKEMPGILVWALQGCMAWLKNGLGTPQEITDATESYRNEMDLLGQFISECCYLDDSISVLATDLYGAYGHWCKAADDKPLTQTVFGLRLNERGFGKGRNSKGKIMRVGLGLNMQQSLNSVGNSEQFEQYSQMNEQNKSAHEDIRKNCSDCSDCSDDRDPWDM